MRNFEITYRLRNEVKTECIRVVNNIGAFTLLMGRLTRRDKLFFTLIRVNLA